MIGKTALRTLVLGMGIALFSAGYGNKVLAAEDSVKDKARYNLRTDIYQSLTNIGEPYEYTTEIDNREIHVRKKVTFGGTILELEILYPKNTSGIEKQDKVAIRDILETAMGDDTTGIDNIYINGKRVPRPTNGFEEKYEKKLDEILELVKSGVKKQEKKVVEEERNKTWNRIMDIKPVK